MDSIVLRKKSLPEGTVRDYGSYGKYQKQEGKWKRLKKGYPTFRRPLSFKLMKSFLLCQKSFEEDQFETLNGPARSEEHTSELQSRLHLVCRLLLEKKKK